ncbi:helix-turn-helix domain-containing protein, partial [Actinomadura kijaniata]|uniref:helix-turn-helix domain-containing protein n=1 Tax=Actinomadura kijaniata TaxID=46161 RepID=UPI003F1D414D
MRRLLALEEQGKLAARQVREAAAALEVSERTLWRWLRQAREGEGLVRRGRARFEVSDQVRALLAYWRG